MNTYITFTLWLLIEAFPAGITVTKTTADSRRVTPLVHADTSTISRTDGCVLHGAKSANHALTLSLSVALFVEVISARIPSTKSATYSQRVKRYSKLSDGAQA